MTVIPVGPYHPLQEEPEFFRLHVEGEKVVDCEVNIGYNHRGIEKLSEEKSFEQIPFLVERVCGICSASHPYAFCRAVETMADIEIPPRARYLRTILAELERLHSHLLWLGLAGHFLGYDTVFMWVWKYREPVLDLLETITGNRNHYAFYRVGGVRYDIEDIEAIEKTMDEVEEKLEMLQGAVSDDPVLQNRLKGVGVLTPEDSYKYGAVGPTSRASGIPDDIRETDKYGAYGELDWEVSTRKEGDVFGKTAVRIEEMFESVSIIRQALDKLPQGDIAAEVKEIPPGEGAGRIEAPRGEVFHYIRSDGSNRPLRHKIRAPSFNNVPTFKETVIGEEVPDALITLAAVDPCYSCTERMMVLKDENKEKLKGEKLLELSQKKTEMIKKKTGKESTLENILY